MVITSVRTLAVAAFLYASAAGSAPIQFDFTGAVTGDAIGGCGSVVACGAVTGSYVFDSAAVDGNPSADTGLYAATSVTLSIDGTPFFSAASGVINVANFAVVDQYGLLALGGAAANGSIADLSMLLQDFTALAFGSDALPLAPGALALLLPGAFTLFANDDTFQLQGVITAITCSSGCGGGPVPEPTTILLLAIGLVGLGLQRQIATRMR